jgi:membrane protease YdiL (CAAX protease family)
MPTMLDLAYILLVAVGLPLYGYFVFLPQFRRRVLDDPVQARHQLWISGIVELWVIVAIGAALWLWFDRPWSAMKFNAPEGWRLWVGIAIVGAMVAYQTLGIAQLRRDRAARDAIRASFTGEVAHVLPRTRAELRMFTAVSVTAGFCEEFLYRGFILWALAPWLGWWGAAAAQVVCFGLGHAYQGWQGMLKTGIFGAVYTAVMWLCDSIWPAIAMHALWDALSGVAAWVVLREEPPR